MPFQPHAQAGQAREKHPFGNVHLVELIPDLPLEVRRNNDAEEQLRMGRQPVTLGGFGTRHHGKKGILVHYPGVE